MNRHFRQRFAIELNPGFVQAMDELTVAQPVLLDGGVDPNDPQLAEFAFADATVAECECARTEQGFFDGTRQIPAATAKTFGSFEKDASWIAGERHLWSYASN